MRRHIRQLSPLSAWPLCLVTAGAFFTPAAPLAAQTRGAEPPPLYGPMSAQSCATDPPGFVPFWEDDPAVLTAKLLSGQAPSGVTITQMQLIGGGAAPDFGNGYHESFYLSDNQYTLTIPGGEKGSPLILGGLLAAW